MGRSNLIHGLERKLGHLLGELVAKREEVERAEKIVESLPALRDRLWEIQTLIEATEAIIKSIKPGWKRDGIDPIRPFVHQIPVKLGEASRKALDVLRTATHRMTTREIADEVLNREGIHDANWATRERLRNTIDASLRSKRGSAVQSDGLWPQRWWSIANSKAVSDE